MKLKESNEGYMQEIWREETRRKNEWRGTESTWSWEGKVWKKQRNWKGENEGGFDLHTFYVYPYTNIFQGEEKIKILGGRWEQQIKSISARKERGAVQGGRVLTLLLTSAFLLGIEQANRQHLSLSCGDWERLMALLPTHTWLLSASQSPRLLCSRHPESRGPNLNYRIA